MKRTTAGLLVALTVSGCAGTSDSGWTTLIDGPNGMENFDRVGSSNWAVVDRVRSRIGAATAPSRQHARYSTSTSSRLGDCQATTAPAPMPSARNPPATRDPSPPALKSRLERRSNDRNRQTQ